MNETFVLKAAQEAAGKSAELLTLVSPFVPENVLRLGMDLQRAGNAISNESQLPDAPVLPDEPPFVPEPEPEEEIWLPGGSLEIPELPAFTKTIEKNGGSCVVVKGDNKKFAHMLVRYGQWMGFDIPKQDGTNGVVGFMLDACQLETGWAGDYKGWGIRGYDMAQFHYRKTHFICTNPFGKNIEHGNYQNIYGGGLLEDCIWFQIPGQASQYVWAGREPESANFTGLSGKNVAGDVVRYLNCKMFDCGHWGNGRASYMLSMFKGQVGLTLENHLIQKTNQPQIHGAILFQGMNKESLQMLKSRVYLTGAPDREMVQCTNAKYALVDGGEYQTKPGHEVKGLRFMDCGQVEIKGSPKGNVSVWIGKAGNWHTKTTLAKVGAGTIL